MDFTVANDIEEADGVIRLVSNSRMKGKQISVDAGDHGSLADHGIVDVSSKDYGGDIRLLGHHVHVGDAYIDASGNTGGGTVLIGGDYKGGGDVRTSFETFVEPAVQIYADAYDRGDGGKVIVWADDTTVVGAQIYARGGSEEGDGGFVETSGKSTAGFGKHLCKDTSTSKGKTGDWLLDLHPL